MPAIWCEAPARAVGAVYQVIREIRFTTATRSIAGKTGSYGMFLAEGRRSRLACDLVRSASKGGECGVSGIPRGQVDRRQDRLLQDVGAV